MSGFVLKVIEGSLKGEEFLFEETGLCLIGRDSNCSISIPREKDVGISRRHCMLIIDSPNIRIRDLYSTNGTYVNGHRLIPSPIGDDPKKEDVNDRFLLNGDKISISNIVMEVQVKAEVDSCIDTTSFPLEDPIPTTQTTKTRLIEFARGRTRSDSLIPEPNSVDKENVLSLDGPLEDTHLFLSLPITEPIPRPKKWKKENKSQAEDKEKTVMLERENNDNIKKEGSTLKGILIEKDKTTESATKNKKNESKNEEKTMPEKPDLSIITGSTSRTDSEEAAPVPEENTSLNREIEEASSSQQEESKSEQAPPPPPPKEEEKEENTKNEEIENKSEDNNEPSEINIPEPPQQSPEIKLPFDPDKMIAMEELAGTLASDFNEQFATILEQAELLKEENDIEKIREYADVISRTVQLSTDMTDQLLMFASDNNDSGNEKVNLAEVLSEIVSVMKHTAGRKIEVKYTSPAKSHTLYTMGNQLDIHEALLNISFNALEAISGSGTLNFQIQPVVLIDEDISKFAFLLDPGSFIKITIKDSGGGIDDKDFYRIFDPFFTTKSKDQALGMGLTVAYGVIKNHKGAINIQSSSDKGTTFEIYFPLTEKE
jgi:signal transduction histidine kinase/pSer/pThr/pTyr-binding forkhead associated (FHA) protein